MGTEIESRYEIVFNHPLRTMTEFGNDLQIWQELTEVIQDFTFYTEEQEAISIHIDWGDTIQWMQEKEHRNELFNQYLENDELNKVETFLKDRQQKIEQGTIKLKLSVPCFVKSSCKQHQEIGYIHNFLHYIFLAMNFASPGSLNLHLTSIIPEISVERTNNQHILHRSGFLFEGAVSVTQKFNWPAITIISVSKVWKWLQQFHLERVDLAETSTERAICALLHACNEAHLMEPTKLIWLAHALEAIYDTPKEGIIKTLRERIFLFLEEPSTHKQKLRKAINLFYELRSQFVHGDLAISNPMTHKIHSGTYENYIYQLIDELEFATSIIVATFQKLILNNWHHINFIESYTGESLESQFCSEA